jgi:uncharacterized protein YjiS (DUF1127 family)
MSTVQLKTFAGVALSALGGAHAVHHHWSWIRVGKSAARRILAWHQRARERRHLETLSDHMLRDIGLTRADVLAEATKRFWQR